MKNELLFLLCIVAGYASALLGTNINARWDVRNFQSKDSLINFEAVVISVEVHSPINISKPSIRRLENDDIESKSNYPEEYDSTAEGLTTLRCNNGLTVPSVLPINASYPPLILASIESFPDWPEYDALSTLLRFQNFTNSILVFSVVLAFQREKALFRRISRDQLQGCKLEFLAPEDQTHSPPGSFQYLGQRLSGALPLASEPDLTTEFNELLVNSRAIHAMTSILSKLCCPSQSISLPQHTASPQPPATAPDYPLMRTWAWEDPHVLMQLAGETSLLELQVPNFKSMVQPIFTGLLSPLKEPIAGVFNTVLGFSMASSLGGALEAGLGDEVPLTLARSVGPALNRQIVPQVTEVVTDQAPPGVAMHLMTFIVEKVTNKVTEDVTTRILQTVLPAVVRKVDLFVPAETGLDVARTLGPILTKALTHSVSPALAHVLGHSPLSDYFCYYCFHQQIYCEYCQYSPAQNYWTMYYAGYYSSWYSYYYSDYATDTLESGIKGEFADVLARGALQELGRDPLTGQTSQVVLAVEKGAGGDARDAQLLGDP